MKKKLKNDNCKECPEKNVFFLGVGGEKEGVLLRLEFSENLQNTICFRKVEKGGIFVDTICLGENHLFWFEYETHQAL